MKVILQQDVKGKGKKGQMIEVSDGYARNYMLPRKIAVEATADNINTMRMTDKARVDRETRERAEAVALRDRMKEIVVHQRGGAVGPHSACIGTGIAVIGRFVVLGRLERHNGLAVGDRQDRVAGLPVFVAEAGRGPVAVGEVRVAVEVRAVPVQVRRKEVLSHRRRILARAPGDRNAAARPTAAASKVSFRRNRY